MILSIHLLGNVAVVAYMFLAGGIFLIFMDHIIKEKKDQTDDEISYKTAFKIGMFQVIAMIPGVSRSAATIIGGMVQGLSRKTAAEFSFFLAVPTMFAATVYKLYEFYKSGVVIEQNQITLLVVGNIVAFIVAILAIRSFIGVITKYGLKVYGYYRIAVGVIIILLMVMGVDLQNCRLISMDFETGEVLLMNKPLRWTSFDVVAKIRGALRVKKVGHAGTLDPLATGLLIFAPEK